MDINMIWDIVPKEEAILCIRIIVAFLLGGVIGLERLRAKGDPAILRMHIFICVGAALVSSVGAFISMGFDSDPVRIAAQVVGSIGFLGMGVIFRHGQNISGLTTASSLWVVGCIGVAVGLGAYLLSVVAALLILFVLLTVKDKQRTADIDENNKKNAG